MERWSEPCLVKAVVTRLGHLLHVVKSNNPKTTPDPVFKEPPVQLTDNLNSSHSKSIRHIRGSARLVLVT